jgi:hypothetical protein
MRDRKLPWLSVGALAVIMAGLISSSATAQIHRNGIVVDYAMTDALARQQAASTRVIDVPGAGFLRVHFASINLGPGDWLELRDANGVVVERYADAPIADLWSLIVYSPPASLVLSAGRGGQPGYAVDQVIRGDPLPIDPPCGPHCPTHLNVECANDINSPAFNPPAYANNRPVCRLHGLAPFTVDANNDGIPDFNDADNDNFPDPNEIIVVVQSFTCTGWMVGSPDCLITNWHCTHVTDLDLPGPPFSPPFGAPLPVTAFLSEFNFQCDACPQNQADNTVGATYRIDGFVPGRAPYQDPFGHAARQTLDYALLDTTGSPGVTWGILGVDAAFPSAGADMYIINHSAGAKKGIGFGEFEDFLQPGSCGAEFPVIDVQVQYSVPTLGGSSGSPVFCSTSHRVEALHHCGVTNQNNPLQCLNPAWGVPMALIAPEIAPAMDNVGCQYNFLPTGCPSPDDILLKCTYVQPDPFFPNCCLFSFQVKNNGLFPITEFYLDIEAGTGAQVCNFIAGIFIPGWTSAFCYGYDNHPVSNRAVIRFADNRLFPGESANGTFVVDVNGQQTVHVHKAANWEDFKVPPLGIHCHVTTAIPAPGMCAAGLFGPHILGQQALWGPAGNWVCPIIPLGGCPDFDDDGQVGVTDFLAVLAAWGPCAACPEDLDGDGTVGITDFLEVLEAWGVCP